jgi:hypothetical protein
VSVSRPDRFTPHNLNSLETQWQLHEITFCFITERLVAYLATMYQILSIFGTEVNERDWIRIRRPGFDRR